MSRPSNEEFQVTDDAKSPKAYLISADGERVSFGDFLDRRQRASSKPVAAIAKEANVSRANYYLLRGDEQRPSLATAIALLSVLGLRSEVPGDDESTAIELRVYDGEDQWDLVFDWSEAERRRERLRFWTSTAAGLSAASAGVSAGAALGGVVGVAGIGLGGAVLPIAAPAVAAYLAYKYARRSHDVQRLASQGQPELAPPVARDDLIGDFKAAAEELSVEDLQALLDTMKAIRDGNSATGTDAGGPVAPR
jgi:hypothetical protein